MAVLSQKRVEQQKAGGGLQLLQSAKGGAVKTINGRQYARRQKYSTKKINDGWIIAKGGRQLYAIKGALRN